MTILRHPLGSSWALKYAKKIDYLSPVWFDFRIKRISKSHVEFFIEGDHNVDQAFIKQIKANNPDIRIYPRVYIDGGIYEDLAQLFNSYEPTVIAATFAQTFKKFDQEFDGIVFDSPLVMYAQQLQFDLLGLLQLINENFAHMNKNIIISLLANQKPKPSLLEKLTVMSHKLLICTYDFVSQTPNEYPLSPYDWTKDYIETFFEETNLSPKIIRKKLMMGIPFYGQKIDFKVVNRETLINKQYLEILEKQQLQLTWNQKLKECVIQYLDLSTKAHNHVVYPCLKFIKTRLELFDEFEVGAFIWEAGQGLEYFYELF